MIRIIFMVFMSIALFVNSLPAAITRKKEVDGQVQYYTYYGANGKKINKEIILKNKPSVFLEETKINGAVKEFDKDGNLLYLWHYVDNKKEGRALGFYPGGQKKFELNYSGDMLQGIGIKYFDNGSILEKVFFVDGKAEGPAHVYLSNGNYYKYNYVDGKLNGQVSLYDKENRLLESAVYKDNLLEGDYIKYYLSGVIKAQMTYKRGKLEDYARYFDEKGREVSVRFYKNGKEVNKILHSENLSHTPNSENLFLKRKGLKTIMWQGPAVTHIEEAAEKVNKIKFFEKKKVLNGKYTTYDRNGNPLYEGRFVNGVADGEFKSFTSDRMVVSVDRYVNGKLSGISKMYYSTGELLAEYRYRNGKLEGISCVYNKDGSLIMEANYKNNLLHGSIKNFYANSILCFEGYFSNGEPVGQLRYYFPTSEQKLMFLIEFKDGKIYKSTAFSQGEFLDFVAEY